MLYMEDKDTITKKKKKKNNNSPSIKEKQLKRSKAGPCELPYNLRVVAGTARGLVSHYLQDSCISYSQSQLR